MLRIGDEQQKKKSEVAISCRAVFKLFRIICGHSTLSPAIFQPLAEFSRWSHMKNLPYLDVTW
jgi:hypothetical protein